MDLIKNEWFWYGVASGLVVWPLIKPLIEPPLKYLVRVLLDRMYGELDE